MSYKAGWLFNGRSEETIGGGFVVMRRSRRTKRVRPSFHPFEYDTESAAAAQAAKLAGIHPEYTYDVFKRINS